MSFKYSSIATILGAVALSAGAPSWASLVDQGITYTLSETVISPTMSDFTLGITGINGPADKEANLPTSGRFGVQSFAFNDEGTGWTITPPSGFTVTSNVGLNSSGCDKGGTGFFCFAQPSSAVGTTILPANSKLDFSFSISGTGLSSWMPDFKINWLGTKNNYDLVSEALTPTVVPLSDAALPLLLGAIAALGFIGRRNARSRGIGKSASA